MASKSDYLENKNLNHNTGKAAYTMPTALYLALCTVVPTDASTGATLSEANYTGYARKKVEPTVMTEATAGETANNAILEFATCTAGSSTIVGWALCDAATGGNVSYWGTCGSTAISTTATPPTVNAGVLKVAED